MFFFVVLIFVLYIYLPCYVKHVAFIGSRASLGIILKTGF